MRWSPGILALLAALMVALMVGCPANDDTEDRLKTIRLFSVDSVADTIRELNAKTGKELNMFMAPGPGISGAGCGLAYDSATGTLFFHDSNMGPEIWAIDPDDPDPTGTAMALPTLAPNPDYVGLGHDGTFLMALRPGLDRIDWLNPTTGDYIRSWDYPEDLEEGVDSSTRRLFASGQNMSAEWVIYELNFTGGVVTEFTTNIPGFMPRAIGFARGILFIADMGNLEILVVDIDSGDLLDQFKITGATSVCGLAAGRK